MIELLAPAGDREKLETALHFGADAVYLSAKRFGLRAFATNFEQDQLKDSIDFVHKKQKKAYVTINIFAKNSDFLELKDYVQFLQDIGADAVIVSDAGVISYIKKFTPKLKIHLSTQANTTNKYSAQFWSQLVDRIILARELSISEIKEISEFLPNLPLESFVHGAMCMSYSGRCLISDFFTNRASNRGECFQPCRLSYTLINEQKEMIIEQDERGSYILNSRDLNMIEHLDKLYDAGISSFKIEGRAKSPFYVAGTVNAYRRAINLLGNGNYVCPKELVEELRKISHRDYCTGFYFSSPMQCYESSKPKQEYEFSAIVIEKNNDGIIVEQRNRFKEGDYLEILSPKEENGKSIKIEKMYDLSGERITDALKVQQKIFIPTELNILKNDILKKIKN